MTNKRTPRSRPGSLTALPVPSTPQRSNSISTDGDAQRTLLGVAVLRVALATVALAALAALVWFDPNAVAESVEAWQYAVIGVTYAATIVYLVLLQRRLWIDKLSWAQITLDALTVSIVVLMTGGSESVFTFAYIFVVFASSITLPRRAAILAAAIASAMFGLVLFGQSQQILRSLPTLRLAAGVYAFVVHTTGMFLVAWLGSRLADNARRTVQQLAETAFDYEQLQELHASILRSLPTGLMTIDPLGVVRYANEAASSILARANSHMLGQPLSGLVPSMEQPWIAGRSLGFEASKGRFQDEHTQPDGTLIRLGYSFAPLETGEGACVVVFQDVTEVLRLEEAVERAQRLATVGEFAAGLAHEVRNPLASICASIQILEKSLEVPPKLKRLMTNVVSEAERVEALIRDFLAFARPRSLTFGEVDLNKTLHDLVEIGSNDPKLTHLSLSVHADEEIKVRADADMIRQVLWNLMKNAAEAIGEKPGNITLRAQAVPGGAVLSVIDDGPGISKELQTKIFDPFYTTKEGGSGLGLAITHAIIEAHGATLTMVSAPGEGTEVRIRFFDDARTAPSEVPSSTYDLEPLPELSQGLN